MLGISFFSASTNSTFGKDYQRSRGGRGFIQGVSGPAVAVTPKSVPVRGGFRQSRQLSILCRLYL